MARYVNETLSGVSWLGFRRKQITFGRKRRLTQSRWSFFGLFRLAIVAITAFFIVAATGSHYSDGFFSSVQLYSQLGALVMYFAD
mgnify:CR=1 FL=1